MTKQKPIIPTTPFPEELFKRWWKIVTFGTKETIRKETKKLTKKLRKYEKKTINKEKALKKAFKK